MAITIVEYKKALDALADALNYAAQKEILNKSNEFKIVRDACIQRFEFCIELAWKTSKKLMGSSATAAKIVVREMAQNGLIDSPELWFSFIEARNETSHTYDEDLAQKVFIVTQSFLPEGNKLLKKLESL